MTPIDWHHLLDTVILPILLALLAIGAGSGTSLLLFRRQQRKADEEIRKLHVETSLMPLEAQDRHQLAQASTLTQLLEAALKIISAMRQRLDDADKEYQREHNLAVASEQRASASEQRVIASEQRVIASEQRAIAAEHRAQEYRERFDAADQELRKVNLAMAELKTIFELCSEELKEKVGELLKLNEIVARLEAQIAALTQRMDQQ